MIVELQRTHSQRGITLFGLLFWAIVIGFVALVVMRVLPTVNEYYTIKSAVKKIVQEGASTVPEVRAAFERRKSVEYSISSVTGNDLQITKVNDQVVVNFAYDKQIELMDPVYLLIKYQGSSR